MDYSLKYAFKSLADLNEDVELKHQKVEEKEKNNLTESLEEGYVGQTVEEFLNDCIESSIMEKITVADNDADDFTVVYEGIFDEMPDYLKEASFDDFDCGGDKIVINVEKEGEGSQYYSTVADFIDDYNGDEIEIQEEGEVLFSGDKYDIPEELQSYAFVSYDAPEYICINAREIEKTNESLITEVYSESVPEWFKNKLKGKHNDLKKKLVNKGVDLNNIEFIEDEIPESAYDPKFKREDIYPVFLLKPDKWSTSLYIKGINDNDTYNDEYYHTKHFGSTPIKQLINMATNYGYFTTDPSNFNTEKRKERTLAKKGMEEKGKGQYKSYEYVSGHRDEKTGEWINGHYDKDKYVWVTPKGEDKSGYKSRFEEIKSKLYSADLTNYKEKLTKFEDRLEKIRKEIIDAASKADFKDKSPASNFGKNKNISYVRYLSDDLDDAIGAYMNFLDSIDNVLSKEDKDEQDEQIKDIFSGEAWYSDIKPLTKSLEKAEDRIKEFHKDDKNESLEESWVDLSDEKQIEEEKEKAEKEKDETPVMQIVDPSASIVDELQDNYLGYAALSCNDCKTPVFKKPEELEKTISTDPETGKEITLYNVGLECTHCGSTKGYDLLGQIATLDAGKEKPEEEVKVEEEEVEVEEEQPTEAPKLENTVEEEVDEEESNVFESLTDFDEVSFDKHINKYLTEVYDNVTSYKSTDGSINDKEIIIEGIIKFNSGKESKTSFKLTLNGSQFSGLNESFAKEENSYSIEGKVENNTFITENISYKYKIEEDLIEGCTKEDLIEETTTITEETNMDKIMKVLDSVDVKEELIEEDEDDEFNYNFTVYELNEFGEEVTQLESFDDLDTAVNFAQSYSAPTHIVYVPDFDPDDDPENVNQGEYGDFEVVWSSIKEDLTENKFHYVSDPHGEEGEVEAANEEEAIQKAQEEVAEKVADVSDEIIDVKEEEKVEESKSNHEFEVGWFEGLTEEEAKQGDPIFKKFTSKQDALDYYDLTKDDEGKFEFFIKEWDEEGELVDNIL